MLSVCLWQPLWSSGQSSWLQIQRSGFNFRLYEIFGEVVGLERGALSLASTTEELLDRKSSGFGLEIREYGRVDQLGWPRDTLYPQKSALTSPTSGSQSVGIVRSLIKATEFCLSVYLCTYTLNFWSDLSIFTKLSVNVMSLDVITNNNQLQWPLGLRHEPSLPAQTLGSWVWIPFVAWISVCVYSVFVLFSVGRGLAKGWSSVQGVLPTCIGSINWESNHRPTKSCRAIITIPSSKMANASIWEVWVAIVRLKLCDAEIENMEAESGSHCKKIIASVTV
jgi:hypothetical protein